MPWIAVASASRALYAKSAAAPWAIPPAATANGKISSGDLAFPYQPTRFAVTMNVPAAKPYSPRMDGAAIGCRNTRAWSRHSVSSPLTPLVLAAVAGLTPVLITNLLETWRVSRRPESTTPGPYSSPACVRGLTRGQRRSFARGHQHPNSRVRRPTPRGRTPHSVRRSGQMPGIQILDLLERQPGARA